ncbi:hypothetical protein Hanom_Chr02g00144751 [Helianthus anomalus]
MVTAGHPVPVTIYIFFPFSNGDGCVRYQRLNSDDGLKLKQTMMVAMLPVAPRVPAELRRVRSVLHVLFLFRSANTEVPTVW